MSDVTYKQFKARKEYLGKIGMFVAEVELGSGLIIAVSKSANNIQYAFEDAVDQYLRFRKLEPSS